jgi:hypothetical protein
MTFIKVLFYINLPALGGGEIERGEPARFPDLGQEERHLIWRAAGSKRENRRIRQALGKTIAL